MVASKVPDMHLPARMIALGTIINVIAIIAGSLLGLFAGKLISEKAQMGIRNFLGLVTFLVAISMIWSGIKETDRYFAVIGISMLSLIIGNAIGKLIGIQKHLNKAGIAATDRFAEAVKSKNKNFSEGFITATLLFCVGPMAILGALEDGVSGNFTVLAVKASMDGLAAMAFASTFGIGVILSAIPVGIYQGTLTLAAAALSGSLSPPMIASIGVTGGMIVMTLPLIIMNIGKVPVSDYLPSLLVAPLFANLWLG